MSSQRYDWKRFWCPRGEAISLIDDGYLLDPEQKWGHIYNSNVVSFAAIATTPCLVLLGEPGIGKSDAIDVEWTNVSVAADAAGGRAIFMNLRSYGNEDRFVRDLFEHETFVDWCHGNYKLHLFLDSLDECLLRVDNMAALLADKLAVYPIERLFVRIACRTADWPAQLEDDLKKLWRKGVGVYELAPLRRRDVIEAAQANEIDADAFLREVGRANAEPLAIKPITLQLLLSRFRIDSRLPSSREELYYDGCLRLCEEHNRDRLGAGRAGEFDPEHRLIIAARIAAAMVFANRYAVWRGDSCDVHERGVAIAELVGETESIIGQEVAVTRPAVEEALSTGLFTARGEQLLGWFHQSYAEFLAAWYVEHHEATVPQVMSLLVHPSDPEGRIAPQLNEVAAWLAGMSADVFIEIVERDPEVLLRSDMAEAGHDDKEALIEALLRLYETEKRLDPWTEHYSGYTHLLHPRLAYQLRPFLKDGKKAFASRVIAINIAEACKARELQSELAHLVQDNAENITLRAEAAHALRLIGDDATKAELKQLLAHSIENDKDDELKGNILNALWPDQLSAAELFTFLTPPKRRSHLGAYKLFILNSVASNLSASDLPEALRWVEAQEVSWHESYSRDSLADQIMLAAWENLDAPGVLDAFAKAALARLRSHREIADISEAIDADDSKRRSVIKAIVPIALADATSENDMVSWLVNSPTPIVTTKDLLWLVEQLQAAEGEEEEPALVNLIQRSFNPQEPEHLSTAYKACKANERLKEAFAYIFEAVVLGSSEAEEMKASFLRDEDWRKRRKRPILDPTPSELIIKCLDEFDSGDINAWVRITELMRLEPDGARNPNLWEADLTALPGWTAADEAIRERTVEAALSFIAVGNPDTEKWLGSDKINFTAIAGYMALYLLFQERPDMILSLSAEVWQKWAPTILAFPLFGGGDDVAPYESLLAQAYRHAPSEVISTALVLIDKDNQGQQCYLFGLSRLNACWDDRLAAALLEKARDKALKPKCMGQLLSELLEHNTEGALEFAASILTLPISKDKDNRARAIQAASALLAYTEDAAWSVVWPAVKVKAKFGREVIQAAAGSIDRGGTLTAKLSEQDLADLFVWLTRQFPHTEKSDEEEDEDDMASPVGPMDSIKMLRDSALRRLQDGGTVEACAAIEKITAELPELKWLKWTLQRARDVTRRSSWRAPSPSDITALVSNDKKRLVQNGDQLLDVVIESLKRLERELQGETPSAWILWNEIEKGKFQPRGEEYLSDYVKLHLTRDLKEQGIIFNREVVIRRVVEGERTDVHVDAVTDNGSGNLFDALKVIIEAKGCWNQNLDTDMEEQLAKRYLKDNECQHGLYLIGLYYCEKWDNEDYKKVRCRRRSKEEAQAYFDKQAETLSAQEGKKIRALVINTALR